MLCSFLFSTYLVALVAGLVLSFITRAQFRRKWIRIATGILSVPAVLLLALIALFWFNEPPSLVSLQRRFPSKHADLETLVRMSNEDSGFSRIAPTFLDRHSTDPNEAWRHSQGDPKAGLPEARWNEYRQIYARNGIKLGVQRDAGGDVFIMVDSLGLLNRGHTTGYLHCVSTVSDKDLLFAPCVLREERGEHHYDPTSREEGYSFQRIASGWFAYDEGPS